MGRVGRCRGSVILPEEGWEHNSLGRKRDAKTIRNVGRRSIFPKLPQRQTIRRDCREKLSACMQSYGGKIPMAWRGGEREELTYLAEMSLRES
jgi:hypothetical protein